MRDIRKLRNLPVYGDKITQVQIVQVPVTRDTRKCFQLFPRTV